MIEYIKQWRTRPLGKFESILVHNGAQIIDVGTKGEYQSGHIQGSLNIPLQSLTDQMGKIKERQNHHRLLRIRFEKCLQIHFKIVWLPGCIQRRMDFTGK